MSPFGILAIHVGNGGQGIDEKPITVHKGVQSCFILNNIIGRYSFHKVCCSTSISGSISGNLGDFSQLKLNSAFFKHYSNFEPIDQYPIFHKNSLCCRD